MNVTFSRLLLARLQHFDLSFCCLVYQTHVEIEAIIGKNDEAIMNFEKVISGWLIMYVELQLSLSLAGTPTHVLTHVHRCTCACDHTCIHSDKSSFGTI